MPIWGKTSTKIDAFDIGLTLDKGAIIFFGRGGVPNIRGGGS